MSQTETPSPFWNREHYYHARTLYEVHNLVGRSNFIYHQTLDDRALHHGKNSFVFLAHYYNSLPLPSKFNGWLETPPEDSLVTIKRKRLNIHHLEEELNILKFTNQVFPPDTKSRPIRLFGYGQAEVDPDYGYLVEEALLPPYLSLAALLTTRNLPLTEALDITIAFAQVLVTCHNHSLVHGDLEGQDSVLRHIFWNPVSGSLRLIDWEDAFHPIPKNYYHSNDQAAIGQLLLLTAGNQRIDLGKNYIEPKTAQHTLTTQFPSHIATRLLSIINHSIGWDDYKQYPLSARGTAAIHTDLLTLKDSLL